jgi:small-conductance mechanosensitive channel
VLTGAFGVGIGFGLQTIVNNFVSGLILLFERPIQIGDTVQVGDMTGDVKRIGIRSSTLRTGSGAELIVPNSMLMSERVINWTLSDTSRRIDLPVGVAYGAEPERVLELLKQVARKHADVLQYPEPVALFVRFGESAIDFELRAWVQDGTRWQLIKTELAVALFRSLKDARIEIPFPQREVRVVEKRG